LSLDLTHIAALIVVAGLSGAGKSTALRVLSDLGFYVVDNLPVPLFAQFVEFISQRPEKYFRTAILPDIDSQEKLATLLDDLARIESGKERWSLLFLDCRTEVIVKRYSETRRPHPGFDPQHDKTLEDAIQRERSRFMSFKEKADFRIDTSDMNVHELGRELKSQLDTILSIPGRPVRLNFFSFGFKYGVPLDCDLVVDVRFLPNPYFVDSLREKTGLDLEVAEHVLKTDEAQEFVNLYAGLLNFLVPRYVFEGKYYINVGIGCTGGRHRSVVIAEELPRRIAPLGCLISVKHRDVQKKQSRGFSNS
jgi:RNase adapter protein RapZ